MPGGPGGKTNLNLKPQLRQCPAIYSRFGVKFPSTVLAYSVVWTLYSGISLQKGEGWGTEMRSI